MYSFEALMGRIGPSLSQAEAPQKRAGCYAVCWLPLVRTGVEITQA